MLVGLATVAEAADPVPDHEHDDWAWWPADVDEWPAEADELRLMGRLLAHGQMLGSAQPAGLGRTPTGQLTPVPPRPQ